VLPSVHVWPSHFNEPVPGTLIPPGSFVQFTAVTPAECPSFLCTPGTLTGDVAATD
jgi:hypothetical protein